ncbi:MAG: ATPase [Legionellales bacterium]|nr:ATPase [Legionellales bacterium]|tara:strand:+ start:35818 stop:37248 length:1431 start_codon:yes stop_codon:yes gene_type:complete
MQPFVGREHEIEHLRVLHSKAIPGLVVVKGRRRIGKSRLIAEFAAMNPQNRLWSFAGLAPAEGMTAQTQRDHFAKQLATHLNIPPLTFTDWSDAFAHLSLHVQPGDIVLLDEISWMGAKDPSFIPKLKAWWDQQTLPIMLVFCGSVSNWIEENILNSTAFYGRVNLTMTLEPLSIPESASLLRDVGFQGSAYDHYKLLSILGGVPWYLEQINSSMTADAHIKRLCFEKDGLLVLEFDRIFHDLFDGKGETYKRILGALKDGMKTLADIRKAIDFAHSGTLSQLIEHLIIAGFVTKQPLWSFKTGKPTKQSLYRISDPYMRFYLKLIEPHRAQIDSNAYQDVAISTLPGFDAHMGLQLEYLLLQNRQLLLKALGIAPTDVVYDGAYRQTTTTKRAGCQIDYLVQTTSNNLLVCEFKFKRRELGSDIIDSMKDKLKALQVPRGFAAMPVLFHIGGVSATVATSRYFYRIVDIIDLLER